MPMMLARLVLLLALTLAPALAGAATPPVSVLYKKDTQTSVGRLDPAVQSALVTLDEKFLDAGFQVLQPDPKIYDLLDRSAGVVVTFAEDAGYSVVFDLVKSTRPYAGTDMTYAEVRIRARVYHGRTILGSGSELGSVAFKSAAAADKAFEAAARRAATKVAEAMAAKLQGAPPPSPPAPSLVAQAADPVPDEPLAIKGRKWALMVGVSDFSNVRRLTGMSGSDLSGVAVDMVILRKTLTDLGVPAERMIWLFNEQATTANVRSALQRLKAEAGPDDLVYLYLSTHGLPKEGGLSRFGIPVTYDFRRDAFIDFEEFRAAIGDMAAENVIWLNDTCYSGLATEGLVTVEVGARDFGIAPPAAFDASAAANLARKNIAVLSSATGAQKAADLGERGGLFTSVVARGVSSVLERGDSPSVYGFFRQQVDGKVQDGFRTMCSGAAPPAICTQGAQQPVFASQRDGKRLKM